MTEHVVQEEGDGFALPLRGFVCVDLEQDDWLVVREHGTGDEARIGLPAEDHSVYVSLVERRARVERCTATLESTLVVEFDRGDVVEVPAGEYEAWEVQGPGPVKVVAPAGGGEPAIFDATSEVRTIHPGDPLPPDLEAAFKSFGLPRPTEAFELRRTTGRTKSIELRAATDEVDRQ
jgi:hypothetical protein